MPTLARPEGRLYYRVDGPAGAPWLAFAHALGTDLSLWAPQLAPLTRRFRVLRYDARGHGQSDTPKGEYSLAQLGGDVLALFDALSVERAHVCGISLGGLTAQWLGVHAPERVAQLVLANTAARIGSHTSWSERIETVRREGLAPLAESALTRWFTAEFRAREPELTADLRERLLATDPAGYIGCCAALREADLSASVAEIAAETLVIVGAHDPVTTRADGEALVARIPRARLLELPAAHLSNVGAAAAFTSALTDFLD